MTSFANVRVLKLEHYATMALYKFVYNNNNNNYYYLMPYYYYYYYYY